MIERTELPFESHFVQIPNAWLRDKRLSRKARGLLAELLTHRVGWVVTVEALAEAGPEGRDAIMSALAELERAGYLERHRERDEGGRLRGARYTITDPPTSDLPTEAEPTEANPDTKNTIPKNTPAKAGVTARARATRIPDPFTVTREMWGWLHEQGIPPEFGNEQTVIFVDYWRGRSGQIATKHDWPATWRNWMRRAWGDQRNRGPRPGVAQRESPDERFRRLQALADEMERAEAQSFVAGELNG